MKVKRNNPETIEVCTLESGKSKILVTVNYTLKTVDISQKSKTLVDQALTLEALAFGRELLRTYKENQ